MPQAQYVNNKELTAALTEWVRSRKHAKDAGTTPPALPEVVALAALKIATRYTLKGNLVHYTYREDFIADALVAVCAYAHNFNPERSTNGFAYFDADHQELDTQTH